MPFRKSHRATSTAIIAAAMVLGAALDASQTGAAAQGQGATDWPVTNYGQGANRYSPLEQITAANVRTLKQAWSFHLKPAGFAGMREDEAIPIVIGNTMYVASPYGAVHALDATTGAQKWKFQLPGTDRPSKRGLAYWAGSGTMPPSIIFGSLSGLLYSVKASDGTPNVAFGQNGSINLKTPEVMQTGMEASYSLLSSATIYKNLIIIGAGTGEGAGGSNAGTGPAGDTRAFDAMTGKLVWTFHTVPRPGELGYDTWKENSAKDRSGVNVWGYTSLDVERGILYMPIGAPNNDRVGVDRPGNNLFSSSVVAVDANTGKYLWHFQVVHHDIWDYDTQSAPLLVDLQRDGKTVSAVIISTKMGLMFTLNRVTGKPIFDVEERPVPKSDLAREQTSPTQPFPVKPPPLTQNTISRDHLYKGEPQHQSYCEHMVDDNDMKLGGPYMPIAFNRYSLSPPGPAGGINFWGASYDPKLHLFISNTNNMFQPMRLILRPDGSYINSGPLAGLRRFGDADRKLLYGPTPWGELVAVNMDTGDIAYRKTLGVSDILPAGMQDTGRPSSGGVMLTASGLTFVGGTDDFRFRAFATATGEKLWEIKMPSSIETTPITYLGSDGRQFVTVVSTGGGLTGSEVTNDEIIAFALAAAGQTVAQPVEYKSPAGVEYRSQPDTDAIRTARAALDANPKDIARIIDLGVAQSGARQFREAIATFTRGLEIEPNNALLLRWRGHRYLSVRDFDRAFADLTRGSTIDPTIYGIWYHLGVVQFLRGNFADAAASFAKAQPIAPDAGELAGSTDWLWMSLSRAGRGAEAKAMLDRRPESRLGPITNAYTRRLQLYRGEVAPEAVITAADTDDVQVATLAYGLGNWYLVRGDKTEARKWFERSVQSGGWPGFGFIVSEVELQRLR